MARPQEGPRGIVVFTDASFHEEMEEPKGGKVDDVFNSVSANRIRLCMFAPEEMDCYVLLSEIDKADYYEYAYDETREDGAAKGLEEFVADIGNFSCR